MAGAVLRCPTCGLQLDVHNWKNVSLDKCRKCEGHWFEEGELTLTIEVVRPIKDWTRGRATELPCVRCAGAKLVDIDFPGTSVSILACRECRGTWLAKGKVDALREVLRPITGDEGRSPLGDRAAEIVAELERVSGDTLCPHCRAKLVTWPKKSFQLERCHECKALWFRSGELTAELGVSRKISLKDARATETPCPHCPKKTLVVVNYPRTDIEIEVCPDCRGCWVSDVKLEQLRTTVQPSGRYPTAS